MLLSVCSRFGTKKLLKASVKHDGRRLLEGGGILSQPLLKLMLLFTTQCAVQ